MVLPVLVIEEIVVHVKNPSLTRVCKLWRNIIVDWKIRKETGISSALYTLRYDRVSPIISLDLLAVKVTYSSTIDSSHTEISQQEIETLMEQCAQVGRCDLLKLLERRYSIPTPMLARANVYTNSAVVAYLTTVRCLRQVTRVQGMSSLSRPLLVHRETQGSSEK